jgi:DivIVA domain-containing protein
MAISFSRPDPSSPTSVSAATFTTTRKGFEPAEVREFLRMVAAELARLQERERFLERELRSSQRGSGAPQIAIDEELVTKMLGEEAARILQTAREAASQIKIRAEDGAARLLRESTDEAQRLRQEAELESSRRRSDATADAEAEIEMAKQQGREMVNEARAYRERVLGELARRREIARQQIEQLVHGRDRLLQAFERSRLAAVDVMTDLAPLGEPDEYVDLSPTTGPVPLMVPNMPRPGVPAEAPTAVEVEVEVEAEMEFEAELADEIEFDEPAAGVTIFVDEEFLADDDVSEGGTERAAIEAVEIEAVEIDAGETNRAEIEPAEIESTEIESAEIEAASTNDAEIDATEINDAEINDVEIDAPESEAADSDAEADAVDVAPAVQLDIGRAADADVEHDENDDRQPAPVVSLFAGEIDRTSDGSVGRERRSADDLFAKLRAARAQTVAQRTIDSTQHDDVAVDVTSVAPLTRDVADTSVVDTVSFSDSVFNSTAEAPPETADVEDTPFARRDEVLTPLIIASARKLKRVLADEQNEVLHALRSTTPARDLSAIVPAEVEHGSRYVDSIAGELTAAAVAGAVSMGMGATAAQAEVKRVAGIDEASRSLVEGVVLPLRERLARSIGEADGDNDELAALIRLIYREWKSQRIDEQLDDVARLAFGRGALAGVAPGTPICWTVDPNGPQCPDAEDNALAGIVAAGDAFPTDDRCAPAHSGCRCMIKVATDR